MWELRGHVLGERESTYRSGLFDSVVRVSVNLVGGPAMSLPEMRKWQQKTLLGVSLKVTAPTGQYDPTKLINLGTNRWAFKPELGLSRRWGNWVLDAYGGVWSVHREPGVLLAQRVLPGRSGADPGPGPRPRDAPELRFPPAAVGVARRQLLAWRHVDRERGRERGDAAGELARGDHGILPRDASPVGEAQLRRGAYIRFGGDFQVLSAAWQYSWISGASMPSTARASGHSSSRQE